MAQLPAITLAAGGQIAIVTQGATPFDGRAAVRCDGRRGRRARRRDRALASVLGRRVRRCVDTARARSAASIRPQRERHRLALGRPTAGRPAPPEPPPPPPRAARAARSADRRSAAAVGSRASSASAASSATSSCSAASRSRPWSRSWRARSASSSQASGRSRAPSTAASRACGCSTRTRRWRPSALQQLAGVGPQAVGHLLAGAEAEPGDERLAARDGVQVRVGGHQPEGVQRAVEHREPSASSSSSPACRSQARARSASLRAARRRRSPSPARC